MLDREILEYTSDGQPYSLTAIASALKVPEFLLKISIDALVPHKLSCRNSSSGPIYQSPTVKSRMPELDKKVDDLRDAQLPGFRPDDPTAIIPPLSDASIPLDVPATPDTVKWSFELPEGMKDLRPWMQSAMGWDMDPYASPTPIGNGNDVKTDSAIRWMGGKSKMLPWLLDRYPAHYAYVEVFGGSLKPFFSKPRSKVEIVNDFYDGLVNFWRVMTHWPEELAEAINALPSSRVYQRWFQRPHAYRNEFEWAVMFGYLSLHSYNGLVWKPFAGTSHQPPGKANAEVFKSCAARLEGVYIECLDFREIIRRYSLKKVAAGPVFTYLDPPYMKTEGYALKFPDEWHQEIADLMVKIHEAGNLVLMTNSEIAGDAYMRWFGTAKSEFRVEYINVDYTLGHADSRGARKEAIISNFKLEAKQGGLFG